MDRWIGRIVLVTGACSSLGETLCKELALSGLTVVGLARRRHRVRDLALELESQNCPGKLIPLKGDVTKEEDIMTCFDWVNRNFGGVDVLINNAGVTVKAPLSEAASEDWRRILDVNVIALSSCTREALKSMKNRGVDDGHIIHINSIAGHRLSILQGNEMYSASKHAVTILAEGLRRELASRKSQIKVTSISPGLVQTEIFEAGGWDDFSKMSPHLQAKDIADAIKYVLSTPANVQVTELIIQPVGGL
ncbi:farnesol dehydrogenase-like isoform X3 [Diaphorina citri]|uniref:Farnesol dehydrogenase-like isoform X3 n=1 Tax=Diaphorina citri TaxID=121845 RepID=A0A1S3CUE5_DIACI|nr:farnesol dehydrogenase-like isoform X3 [Diaphorina citri]KAI5749397.1 hypothetical protein M8J76_007019 [Diaphorina citri]KAI5756056.1 hypothetical protein M8J77_021664 [Diaphorina citri]